MVEKIEVERLRKRRRSECFENDDTEERREGKRKTRRGKCRAKPGIRVGGKV